MKLQFRILFCCSLIGFADLVSAQCDDSILIIFDTDFAMQPADDALAIMRALRSPEPYGGFAKHEIEDESSAGYIEKQVMGNPGEIVIVAMGALTNIAHAIQTNSEFTGNAKQLAIIDGAVASILVSNQILTKFG